MKIRGHYLWLSMIAVICLSSQAFSLDATSINFGNSTRVPKAVQDFVDKLFLQKCEGAMVVAHKSRTRPYVTLEDSTSSGANTTATTLDIVHNKLFPDDYVVIMAVEYQMSSPGQVKVIKARIIDAYDSGTCETGTFRASDLH